MSKSRTFITHVVPKKLIEKLEVSPAGNYFSYNLIDAGLFDDVISLVPTNILKKIDSTQDDIKFIQTRTFVNRGFLKIFNIVIDNIKLFFKIKNNTNVWFYNLTHHSLFIFLLLKFFKTNVNAFIIVLDFTPPNSKFSIQNLILKIINLADGIIVLKNTPDINNNNQQTLPGVVNEINTPSLQNINKKFLLSGILSSNRNPKLILDVFSKFPEYELIITGIVEDKDLLNGYIEKFENIKFLGLLEYNQYEEVLNSVTYCINSRDPKFEENNYNFPSKVIEHLLHNKIIISTMEYEELAGINYFFVKPDEQSFTIFFNDLNNQSSDYLLSNYANQSKFVINKFGTNKWEETFEQIEKFNNTKK